MVILVSQFSNNIINFQIDLFNNTKMDMGNCSLIHSDELKLKYEKTARERDRIDYEDKAERELMSFVTEVDRKIKVILLHK